MMHGSMNIKLPVLFLSLTLSTVIYLVNNTTCISNQY